MPKHVSRRRATQEDVAWLLALRERTMREHLAASGINPSQSEALERLLYRFDVAEVLLEGVKPIGLLKVDRSGPEWRIIQIQIDPELQRTGTGSIVLGELIREAEDNGVSLALDVLKTNRARRLYERLGFSVIGEDSHEYEMRRA